MKLFKCKKETISKSWSMDFEDDLGEVKIKAVDSITGIHLVYILIFSSSGKIYRSVNTLRRLKELGYNPYEHANSFDNEGRIIIE
jgi:hypothetical protein